VETAATLQLEFVTLIDVLFIAVPAVITTPTPPTVAVAPATKPTDKVVFNTATVVHGALREAPTRTAPMPPTAAGETAVVTVFETAETLTRHDSTSVVHDIVVGSVPLDGFTTIDPIAPTPETGPPDVPPGHKTVERATTTAEMLGTPPVAAFVAIPMPPTKRSGAFTITLAATAYVSSTVTLDRATDDCAATPTPPTTIASVLLLLVRPAMDVAETVLRLMNTVALPSGLEITVPAPTKPTRVRIAAARMAPTVRSHSVTRTVEVFIGELDVSTPTAPTASRMEIMGDRAPIDPTITVDWVTAISAAIKGQ
jgi:hypothetical protein